MIFARVLVVVLLLGAPALAEGLAGPPRVASQPPAVVVAALRAAVIAGDLGGLAPMLTTAAAGEVAALAAVEARDHRLARLGPVTEARTTSRREDANGTSLTLQARSDGGSASWTLRFADGADRVDHVALAIDTAATRPGPGAAATSSLASHRHHARRAAPRAPVTTDAPEPPAAEAAPAPAGTAPAFPAVADDRTVEFLLATTRQVTDGAVPRFLPARAEGLRYGIVRVHVPENHRSGAVERPLTFGLLGFTLYEEKVDQKRHFVVTGAKLIGEDDFTRFATGDPRKEALIFVHGFNNSFEDSAYRFAQILDDLHYQRPAILFSWASKGSVLDYIYDKDSAEIARDRFAALVRTLQARGVEKISVIAHSMGNQLAVAALAQSSDTAAPDRVEQLVMAAPDMDAGFLAQIAPALTRVARGVTLYACSTDRALEASKRAAGGMPRAGDVPAGGPLVLAGIDTIDVSALGRDWLGLNHDVFATNRAVMDDIALLLGAGTHPPRLPVVTGMPVGATPPAYWRFAP